MQMTCPKCRGEMRQYERSGVTVDQCLECRGIFLDRGELERLVDAENQWRGGHPQQPRQGYPPETFQPGYPPQHYPQQHQSHGYGHHGHYGHHKKRKRHHRESFFEELFD